jgi:hypothetical protein
MARDASPLINSPRPDSLRFMPALNVTREEVDRMIAVLDAVLGSRGLSVTPHGNWPAAPGRSLDRCRGICLRATNRPPPSLPRGTG